MSILLAEISALYMEIHKDAMRLVGVLQLTATELAQWVLQILMKSATELAQLAQFAQFQILMKCSRMLQGPRICIDVCIFNHEKATFRGHIATLY